MKVLLRVSKSGYYRRTSSPNTSAATYGDGDVIARGPGQAATLANPSGCSERQTAKEKFHQSLLTGGGGGGGPGLAPPPPEPPNAPPIKPSTENSFASPGKDTPCLPIDNRAR